MQQPHSLDQILRNGSSPQGPPLILPASDMVCPVCGFVPRRQPDGQPSDAISFNIDGIISPYYHMNCVQMLLMRRDAEYVERNMEPLKKKEDQDANNPA